MREQEGGCKVRDRFLEMKTQWLTLIGEHLEDGNGTNHEYWRIEKADSVIVLPIWKEMLVLAPPFYRPGVGHLTLDFPGGRVPEGMLAEDCVGEILSQEIGVYSSAIASIERMNETGWAIDGSFSNQKLYGFVAYLRSDVEIPHSGLQYPCDKQGISKLLQRLSCVQCRLILLEWWYGLLGNYIDR